MSTCYLVLSGKQLHTLFGELRGKKRINFELERKARRVREDEMKEKDQGQGDEGQQKHRTFLKKTKTGRRSRSQFCLAGSLSDIREHKCRAQD